MKRVLIILCVVAFHSFLNCQITMETNLPKAMPLNSDVTFEVKIKKGASANYAKYQMEIPRGATIKEVDTKSGSFTFEENSVKIIWVMAPLDPEFAITLKLNTGVVPGKKTFVQKYFYIENDDKKEVEMDPLHVVFKDTASAEPSVSTSEFITVMPKALPSLLTTTINAAEISTKNPELLKQQVLQLKKDSKDAFQVGEREKAKAELKLTEANEAIAKADANSNEEEKKIELEKATASKKKAESDLEVASRVLILAKSLDDNANEIDAINRNVNPLSYSGHTSSDPTIAAGNQASTKTSENPGTSTTVDIDEKDTPEEPKKNSRKARREKEKERELEEAAAEKSVESGLVYKIQLGAFSREPSRRDFKALGKVKITEENGMYKVLYGSFTSKEDAFKEREQIINKGFDGFVVGYQDGVRVK